MLSTIGSIAACFSAVFSGIILLRAYRGENPLVSIDVNGNINVTNTNPFPIRIVSVASKESSLYDYQGLDDYGAVGALRGLHSNNVEINSIIRQGETKSFRFSIGENAQFNATVSSIGILHPKSFGITLIPSSQSTHF